MVENWFLCKKSAALNLSISEIVFLFKGLRVKFVIFELVFFYFGGGMSSCSIYFEVTDIEAAHIIGNFFCSSCGGRIQIFEPQQLHFQQHVHETTRRRKHIDNKKRQRKEDTKKKWTSEHLPLRAWIFSRSDLRPPCDCIALKRKQTIVFPFHPRKGREFLANRPGPREFCQQEEWHFLKERPRTFIRNR